MGRKRIRVVPDDVERLASEGLSEYQIAAMLGVSQDTFTARKKDEPAICAALKRGRARAVGEVENLAFEAAKKAAEDPRYQASLIFFLKTQARWTESQRIEHGGEVGIYPARSRLAETLRRLVDTDDD